MTQAYCAYAKKHEFDTIDTIDILDCNGGDHCYAFATNYNPEINLREVSAPGSYWENGHWVEIPAMSIKREYNFDQVGDKDMYLLHHEEIESLAKNIPEAKRIRFFMTFGQSYLDHMRCLEDVGMLSTTPVNLNGQEIVPIQFLKALLPDPASLGPRTKGKTNIGCIFTGKKDGKDKTYYIYNVCDHQECYKEVGSQAISYTTGVPAMCGALMLLTGKWTTKGVHTVEEFDPDPYLDALDKYGCPAPSHSGSGGLMRSARQPRPPFAELTCRARSCTMLPALLSAGRSPAAPQRRNSAGCAAAHWLPHPAGAEGFFQLQCLPCAGTYLAVPGQRPVRAARQEELPEKENHVFCAAYRADEFEELLQYADHIVFNSPSQLAKFGPAARQRAKALVCASTRSAPRRKVSKSTTPAPPAAVWAPPVPSGTPPWRRTRNCPPCWTVCTSTPCASRTRMRWR